MCGFKKYFNQKERYTGNKKLAINKFIIKSMKETQ